MCNFYDFKQFKAEKRILYEINAWSTDVLHDVLKQVVKCSDRHVFTLVGNGTKLVV